MQLAFALGGVYGDGGAVFGNGIGCFVGAGREVGVEVVADAGVFGAEGRGFSRCRERWSVEVHAHHDTKRVLEAGVVVGRHEGGRVTGDGRRATSGKMQCRARAHAWKNSERGEAPACVVDDKSSGKAGQVRDEPCREGGRAGALGSGRAGQCSAGHGGGRRWAAGGAGLLGSWADVPLCRRSAVLWAAVPTRALQCARSYLRAWVGPGHGRWW